MILSPRIAAALDGLDGAALPCDVTVAEGAHRLVLHLTASGAVGLAFSSLDFQTTARPEWTGEALRAWGDRIAARVNYLMEPLVVLEYDASAGEVELRSHAPTARGDRRSYYMVRIGQAGALHLERTSFDESARRRTPIDCMMTREVLERLIDDIVACIP